MEKTVQITLASMQFQVTESAYALLRSYLDGLSAHFGGSAEGKEIMGDIESRIAEKFIDAKHKLVTEANVHEVIAEIGDSRAFSDDAEATEPANETTGSRKLYRNGDDAIIAGVASGLAAYFGWNTTIVRLAFALSVLFSGVGVAIYIVLWLIMPEARSASQKLEMKGAPVTLETITQVVKDRVEETKARGGFNRIVRFPAEVIRILSARIIPIIGKIIGFFLSIGAFIALIGATVLLGIVLTNWNAPWNDIPHKEIISSGLLKSLLAAGYLAIVIPLVFIFALGQRWFSGRSILTATVGFGLMGVWALSLVSSGVLTTKIVGDYYAYTATSPEYAQSTNEYDVAAFHTLNIERAHVTFRSGDTYSVTITGRKIDLSNATSSVSDGVLTVASVLDSGPCLFCGRSTPTITVTAPQLDTITVRSGSLSFDDLTVPNMNIDARGSNISGAASIKSLRLNLESSWAGLELISEDVRVDARSTRVELEGIAKTLYVEARSSSVDSEALKTREATIDAEQSSVHVRADDVFKVTNDRASDVQNAGNAAGVSETVESAL